MAYDDTDTRNDNMITNSFISYVVISCHKDKENYSESLFHGDFRKLQPSIGRIFTFRGCEYADLFVSGRIVHDPYGPDILPGRHPVRIHRERILLRRAFRPFVRLRALVVEHLDNLFAGRVKKGERNLVLVHKRFEVGRAISVADVGPFMGYL